MKSIASLVLLSSIASLWAGSFAEYPGAVFDKKLTEKAQAASDKAGGKSSTKAYHTPDDFEKVKAFYLKIAKEYKMKAREQKLDDGTVIQKAFFIFDGAAGLSDSKDWAAIQSPLIGDFRFKNGHADFIDVRKNTTSIQRVWKK